MKAQGCRQGGGHNADILRPAALYRLQFDGGAHSESGADRFHHPDHYPARHHAATARHQARHPRSNPLGSRKEIEMARSRAAAKPNIVVIWGDDIGMANLSCYTHGLMGYQTPNIDRIAQEGMRFTDLYAEQSCTAGRSSFITGQHGLRTGLTKVGLPAAPVGLHKEDPTIAELLKPLGYATAQIGKNHLGDRNEYLPTVHGFDEFYGNLYHLNA